MLLSEPPPTPLDLYFPLGNIPVRISPWFWAVSALMASGRLNVDPLLVVTWVLVVFVSILVHELGHALAILYFGSPVKIVLHGMGGLAISPPDRRTSPQQIFISFAGPLAGFLLAGAIILALYISNKITVFGLFGFEFLLGQGNPITDQIAGQTVDDLLFVNIFWGLVNLLPIYPLDGGQISREVFHSINRREGIAWSLIVSIAMAVIVAIAGLKFMGSGYMAFFFAFLAYESYQRYQQERGGYYRDRW